MADLAICPECQHVEGGPHARECPRSPDKLRIAKLEERVAELEKIAHPPIAQDAIAKRLEKLEVLTGQLKSSVLAAAELLLFHYDKTQQRREEEYGPNVVDVDEDNAVRLVSHCRDVLKS